MKHRLNVILSVSVGSALFFGGCATTGSAVQNSDGAESQAASANGQETEGNSDNAVKSADGKPVAQAAAASEKLPEIVAECRSSVVDYVFDLNGKIQVLTADGNLYGIDNDVQMRGKLKDRAENYVLLPASNVVLHFKSDVVMVESSIQGTEYFKLDADVSHKKAYLSMDGADLGLLTPRGTYNVWKVGKDFGELDPKTRVQDFIRRQSPDHQVGFPGDVTALFFGANGHLVLALNETDTGKVGRLFHFDPGNSQFVETTSTSNAAKTTKSSARTGVLKNLVRTNTQVSDVAISASAQYVAAADVDGQFYLAETAVPKFIALETAYNDVKGVLFDGDTPIMVRSEAVTAIDIESKETKFEIPVSYEQCKVMGKSLVCLKDGVLDQRSLTDGHFQKRIVLNDGHYGLIDGAGRISGDLPKTCVK